MSKRKTIFNTGFNKRKSAGFTILEMAVVILISGFIMMAGLQVYGLHLKDRLLTESRDKQDQIKSSISQFISSTGDYPCPADPTLPFDDPNAGIEGGAIGCAGLYLLAMNTCNVTGGICKVPGRDVDGDGNPEGVLVGSVPYVTIKSQISTAVSSLDDVAIEDVLDPWGYQMTYAVTESLTDAGLYDATDGAIFVQTEAAIDLTDPPGSAHYVLVSHGANHGGAYNSAGVIPAISPCVDGVVGPEDEDENCDRDATFVHGLKSLVRFNPRYFDDTISYNAFSVSSLWNYDPGTQFLTNLNPGNVGVGTGAPSQRLEVNGVVTAARFSQEGLCDVGGANCWAPENLGGPTGIQCPAPPAGFQSVVTSIVNGDVVCANIPVVSAIPSQTCPANEYLVGIDGTGAIICEPL